MDIFQECQKVNVLLNSSKEGEARNELIRLLDYHNKNEIAYSPVVNHLIRLAGLYPYLQLDTSSWQDRFLSEAFKVDIGKRKAVLHREQSAILKRLLNQDNIAISAPTSFGKSFVIDAFISIKQPKNVMIIVPTIALTDETRRRLYKKFSDTYKIITTSDVELGVRNIFIFPQERAMNYVNKLDQIDILIVDEFYKASSNFDKERSPILLKAILSLGAKSKQKYFLAPNISSIIKNVFTEDMFIEFRLDFNTVFLKKHDLYLEIGNDLAKKKNSLLKVLYETSGKSLIYAASFGQIEIVSELLIENHEVTSKPLLVAFSNWLVENYDSSWNLTKLVLRGSGIHTGRLHRSLSQIQINLFEAEEGLDNIISTSSIIEGVNTSAENVVIWRNRRSGSNAILDSFTYKNIIGRSGRMFKHFIGNIFLLESPPKEDVTELTIPFPESILNDVDDERYTNVLSKEQIVKIVTHREEMYELVGKKTYDRLIEENSFQTNDKELIKKIAIELTEKPEEWNGLSFLNSDEPENWTRLLYKLVYLQPGVWGDGAWGEQHKKFIFFVKILASNWTKSVPELLNELDVADIGIDEFFSFERNVCFKLSALVNDLNVLYKAIVDSNVDVTPFASRASHAFLPHTVYQLEEYGLPRMISKKIHGAGLLALDNDLMPIHSVINDFNLVGKDKILQLKSLSDFDKYIIEYFFDGITLVNTNYE